MQTHLIPDPKPTSSSRSLERVRVAAGLVLSTAACALACSQEPAVPVEGDALAWAYSGRSGPAFWSSLDPSFAQCNGGDAQSPIDLDDFVDKQASLVSLDYGPGAPTLRNDHHTIEISVDGFHSINVAETRYEFQQLHFHSPSEHSLEGVSFPAELHFVHESRDGWLSVLAVFAQEGRRNAVLNSILRRVPRRAGQQIRRDSKFLDLNSLLPKHGTFIHYAGSLTTPPCSQAVQWFVLTRPIEISKEQLQSLRGVVSDNARPRQPTNGRKLELGALAPADH
jgi:carbonic anhydrase